MKYLILFICLFHTVSNAQEIVITELKFLPDSNFFENKDSSIIYPIINTGKKEISKRINDQIANEVIGTDEDCIDIETEIRSRIAEGLIDLSYHVSLMKNRILSIQINMEGCGAYCSTSDFYFNFNLQTGEFITFSDIVNDPDKKLQDKFIKDKRRNLENHIKLMKQYLNNKEADSATFELAIEIIDRDCIESLDPSEFTLTETTIEIEDHCSFPHIIRSQEPAYELKYSFKSIRKFLTPEFRNLMYNKR